MCYLVRQQHASPEPAGTPPLTGGDGARHRWVGAAAAIGIAGVALAAALVAPPATAPSLDSVTRAAPAPVATPASTRADIVPAAASTTQRSLPADDDVPTVTGSTKAGYGGCSHGL